MKYDLETLEFSKVLEILKEYCKTNYAKSLVEEIKPSDNYEEIIKLNQLVNEAYVAINRYSDIPLGGLYECLESLKRANIGSILEPYELLNIVGLLDCSSNVIRYLRNLESIKLSVENIKEYIDSLILNQTLKSNITLAISNDGKVNDNASKELFSIRRNINSLENSLRSKLNELLQTKASMLTENLIVIRNNRMCLPVKIEYKNSFKGIIHDISSSNTTCYIEPEITFSIANKIENFKALEKQEINLILKSLSLVVSANYQDLLNNLNNLTTLDIIFAKAMMAIKHNYNNFTIVNKQLFNLKKAKHPLIDSEKVVPIDVQLGDKYNAIIITGPNTGGKTVALKTIGLMNLMAYSGMLLPCDSSSTIGMFKEILVDIGDEQSIEQSLSTFSAHMTKMKSIIDTFSFESLILLDELGSGTDPVEGSSLAISMIDYMKKRGAKLIVTTHYSSLKEYAYKTNDVVNASVEFNLNTLKPTYKLLIGVPGKSNAILIASRLGIAEEIIEQSQNQMLENNDEKSMMLANLEEEMNKYRHQEEELAHKIKVYDELYQKLSFEKAQINKHTAKVIDEAKVEANKIIIKAKEEANELISGLNELKAKEYKEHELAELKHKLKNLNISSETIINDEELNVGDYVYIKPYEKNGTIIRINKDKYTVTMGQFTIDFSKNDLIKDVKPKERIKPKTNYNGFNSFSKVGLSLDLRGKRYEEVKELIDNYLDQAILSNLKTVTIIHGFGTGAIRKAVWEYLKTCPYAKSYRYGQEGEGLNGVTIVNLK